MKKGLWIIIFIILILAVVLIYTIYPAKKIIEPDYLKLISDFKNEVCHSNTTNFSISQCTYNGKIVYSLSYDYIANQICADEFEGPVYSEDGAIFCWISGGITEMGSNTCPNFKEQKINCHNVFSE